MKRDIARIIFDWARRPVRSGQHEAASPPESRPVPEVARRIVPVHGPTQRWLDSLR